MEKTSCDIKELYITNEYIKKHPLIHAEDSPWKISKIIPLVDIFIADFDKKEMNLLDVGGGAGLITNVISAYIKDKYNINVNKYVLDLSPGMLEIQIKNNPDIKKALNEDISKTSLNYKEMDLTLMIDILEHVTDPVKALNELKRISKFVIFKIPLEDNLVSMTFNFINRGKPRKNVIESIGHIQTYSYYKLKFQIEKYLGNILKYYFTNSFGWFSSPEYPQRKNLDWKIKIKSQIGSYLFKLSPKLCSFIFMDFIMVLVKCYSEDCNDQFRD